MIKMMARFVLMVTFAVIIAGCAQRADIRDSVKVTVDQPRTFDSRRSDDMALASIMYQIGEGLTTLGADGRALPAVAESWSCSNDSRIFIFKLRADARWSDGSPVRAVDFAQTWLDILDKNFASDRAELLFALKNGKRYNAGEVDRPEVGVMATDDMTLRVELDEPRPFFAEEVASTIYFPVCTQYARNSSYFKKPQQMVCNGPFKINGYNANANLKLSRNEYYYDKSAVMLKGIEFCFVSDANAQLAMLLNGQADLIQSYPARQYQELLKKGYIDSFARSGIYSYILNVKRTPLNDFRVRKALAYAINRRQLTEGVTAAGELPLTAAIPYGLPGIGTGTDFRKQGGSLFVDGDVALAQKLLAQAGYPNGKGFPELTLAYNTGDVNSSVAEAVQEMWKKNLNVEIVLRNMEWSAHLAAIEQGDFDIARLGFLAKYPDPLSIFQNMNVEKFSNGWRDKKFLVLYHAALSQTDINERMKLAHECEKIFVDAMPIIPLYNLVNSQAVNPRLKGIVRNSTVGYYLKKAYFE